jgi:hypothetical protein
VISSARVDGVDIPEFLMRPRAAFYTDPRHSLSEHRDVMCPVALPTLTLPPLGGGFGVGAIWIVGVVGITHAQPRSAWPLEPIRCQRMLPFLLVMACLDTNAH